MSWVVEVRSGYASVLLAASSGPDADLLAENMNRYFGLDVIATSKPVFALERLTLGELGSCLMLDKPSAPS